MRGILRQIGRDVYAALVAAIILWTGYCLVTAYLAWADSGFARDFGAIAQWDVRLRLWLMPTLGLGMIALLIRPR